jgi:cysteine-rich repeat protein
MSFLSYFFLVIFINCVFYLDSSYAITTEVVSICDSNKLGSLKEWNTANPMYTKYILYLYGTGLSANELVLPSKCDSAAYKGFNEYLSTVYTGRTQYVDAFGIYAQCGVIAQGIERAKLGRGLLVNWPSTIPRFYTQVTITNAPVHTVKIRYDISYPHDFVTNTAKSTVWTNIYLIEADQYDASPFYQLPPDLFKQAIQFSAQGFAGLEDYITFSAPAKAKLTQVQGSKGIVWGIITTGCKPPVFKITTNWNTGNDCSFPEIKVTQITEDDSFVCIMQFTNGDTSLNPSVLMQMSYAMAPSLVGRISISTSHAQNILACINPSSSSSSSTSMTQFSFWNQWSETTPGTCSPCAPRRLAKSGATPIPRKCNRTLGETSDCCFTCQPGYNSLQYLGDNNLLQQHCIALCPPGRYYDNPKAFMPRCISCPSGKYSQPDSLACKTCDELGFNNAYAGPTGCISCGTRSLAKGDSASCAGCHTFCSPCPAQTYVPILSITCQECPPGWILRTAQSDTCSPCPPGFYASQGRCLQCPTNTFKVNEGNGSCIPCASGYESVPDRTRCIPCTDLNVNVTPFAIYQPGVSGCAAICNPTVSYAQGTNPYVPEGCVSCKSLKVPNGMYATKEDCSNFLPCINLPTSNSTTILKYTGSGNQQGICPWKCIPGYFLQGSTCYQCNVNGFNDTHHIFIDDCNYACIPGLFFRGLTNSDTKCTQRCVNLNTVLYPYASDYFFFIRNNGTRINLRNPIAYRTGFCGSNAIDPTSELGVVRHIGMFGVLLGSGFCGDSMLSSINEECDDGNTINGDGCNHRCLIERNAYWDCDVLGEPCLPNCGWPNLQGFALPAPPPPSSTAPWCTGIAYARDFLKISMSNRGSWMQSNLIPCQCALNPHQTLPYSECNYTNRGCRQCPIGFFQDDLYARCSKCGSTCALGFWTFQ